MSVYVDNLCVDSDLLRVFGSSRVLYNISQKLILHQLTNYTEILKWLREILACRNKFLNRHKDSANVGSSNKVCKQAHIKLEVCGKADHKHCKAD